MKFVMKELLKTKTGLQNIPDKEAEKNLDELLKFLNEVGKDFNMPVICNSGYRSNEVNKAVGGSNTSSHMKGYATDLRCNDLEGLFNLLKSNISKIDQLIKYSTFVHVSIDPRNRKHILYK